ncbi:hypothetical protein [uncultured Desulfovibrio sp.]|nr:hypothetical protein [uncultured Desulfovibrio sp.]
MASALLLGEHIAPARIVGGVLVIGGIPVATLVIPHHRTQP